MSLLPSAFENTDSRKAVKMLFKSFFIQGGMQLQINVCDAEILIDAKTRPDEYASPVVRVGEYSDYFTRLSGTLQDEIITRTSQQING